jgi:hypothetical protein
MNVTKMENTYFVEVYVGPMYDWWKKPEFKYGNTTRCNSVLIVFFFLIRLVGSGVQLVTLGTAATDWPIVTCPGWLWWWRIWWNEDWQEKPRPSATLSTTNPTWPDPGSNPGRRGGKPATNRLSCGGASSALIKCEKQIHRSGRSKQRRQKD